MNNTENQLSNLNKKYNHTRFRVIAGILGFIILFVVIMEISEYQEMKHYEKTYTETSEPVEEAAKECSLLKMAYSEKKHVDVVTNSTLTMNDQVETSNYLRPKVKDYDNVDILDFQKNNGFVIFNTEGNYSKLQGVFGVRKQHFTVDGEMAFRVYADDVIVYTSNFISGTAETTFFEANINNCHNLKIEFFVPNHIKNSNILSYDDWFYDVYNFTLGDLILLP